MAVIQPEPLAGAAIISVGSNLPGDGARAAVAEAISELRHRWPFIAASAIYCTEAIGSGHGLYANAVVAVSADSMTAPEPLQQALKAIEVRMGRKPKELSHGLVAIDLDLVIFRGLLVRPREMHYEHFTRGYHQIIDNMTQPPAISDK